MLAWDLWEPLSFIPDDEFALDFTDQKGSKCIFMVQMQVETGVRKVDKLSAELLALFTRTYSPTELDLLSCSQLNAEDIIVVLARPYNS